MLWRESPLFKDRIDAARKLVPLLKKYKGDAAKSIIIALPRGGVPMGDVLARELSLPLDIVVPRKIGHPDHMEYAIGALTETGEIEADSRLMKGLPGGLNNKRVQKIIAEEKAEASRRLREYRGDRPPLNLANKNVILVDDGIATGYTMKAAIKSAKARGASKIVVVAPVCAPDSAEALKKVADEVICAATPDPFSAVGLWYERFDQTSDQEVIAIMKATTSDTSSNVQADQSSSMHQGSAGAARQVSDSKDPATRSPSMPISSPVASKDTQSLSHQSMLAVPLPEAVKQSQQAVHGQSAEPGPSPLSSVQPQQQDGKSQLPEQDG